MCWDGLEVLLVGLLDDRCNVFPVFCGVENLAPADLRAAAA
jgi:hypothetical protein